MAETLKTLRVDIATEQSYIYLKCKQYDETSRKYKLIITDRNKPIVLIGNELVMASIERPDKSYVDTDVQWVNDELIFTITPSMIEIAGICKIEFRIFDSNSDTVLSTSIIHMDVMSSVLSYDKMVKSDEFNVLNNLILQANTLPDLIEELNSVLTQAKEELTEIQSIKESIK